MIGMSVTTTFLSLPIWVPWCLELHRSGSTTMHNLCVLAKVDHDLRQKFPCGTARRAVPSNIPGCYQPRYLISAPRNLEGVDLHPMLVALPVTCKRMK